MYPTAPARLFLLQEQAGGASEEEDAACREKQADSGAESDEESDEEEDEAEDEGERRVRAFCFDLFTERELRVVYVVSQCKKKACVGNGQPPEHRRRQELRARQLLVSAIQYHKRTMAHPASTVAISATLLVMNLSLYLPR